MLCVIELSKLIASYGGITDKLYEQTQDEVRKLLEQVEAPYKGESEKL